MPQRNDELLVAYLDDELDTPERQHVEAWLDADPVARERLAALTQSADLLREAFVDIVDEPVPERLIAAASGLTAAGAATAAPAQPEAEILQWRPRRFAAPGSIAQRWVGMAAAAGLFGIAIGSAGTYFGLPLLQRSNPEQQVAAAVENTSWLDNAAGYYKLSVNAGDNMLIDVPASNDTTAALQKISQSLPEPVHPPDLTRWGLNFRGARLVVVEGRPAAELVYVTDNKALGPLTLVIGTTKLSDIGPTNVRQQDVNLTYWRHQGRAYALAGRADPGYLWSIANDVAWQLHAI